MYWTNPPDMEELYSDKDGTASFKFRFFGVSSNINVPLRLAMQFTQKALQDIYPEFLIPERDIAEVKRLQDCLHGRRYFWWNREDNHSIFSRMEIVKPDALPFNIKTASGRPIRAYGTDIEVRLSNIDRIAYYQNGRHARYIRCAQNMLSDIGMLYGVNMPPLSSDATRMSIRMEANFCMVGWYPEEKYLEMPGFLVLKNIGVFALSRSVPASPRQWFMSQPSDCFRLFKVPVPGKLSAYPNKPWTKSQVKEIAMSLLSERKTNEQEER